MSASQEPDRARSSDPASGRFGSGSGNDHVPHVESPSLVPGQGERAEPEQHASAPKAGGTALVIAPEPRRDDGAHSQGPRAKPWRQAKFSSLAASLALAVGVGVIAGAVGALGLQGALTSTTSSTTPALQESLVKLTSEFAALKAGMDAATKNANSQLARLTERLDRNERTLSEPASRLARISEAVERLEKRVQAAPVPPAPIPAAPAARNAAPDVTGSIPDARPVPKDTSRLPVIRGWVLRSVYDGTALVESRMGLMEIEVGDPLPGGGHVQAIRREGGRWIVVTSRGLILAR